MTTAPPEQMRAEEPPPAQIYDGFVSRHLNRRLSDPASRLLAKTPLTPNQASVGALLIAAASLASFAAGQSVLGGILAQVSSIADGVDGSLARLKGMASPFGGFFDAVLDRYSDALVLLGMTLWAASNESYPGTWVVGFFAAVGTIAISYSRARIPPEHRTIFDRGWPSLATRDVRLFLVMLGGISGQVYFCLLLLAVLANAIVFYRLAYSYRYLRPKGG